MSHPISEVLETTMERVRQMVDSSTIVGDPMVVGEVTIIPVTKVNLGFASGGSDFAGKNPSQSGTNCFGGGGGAGVTVSPVGFLVVKGDNVRMIPINDAPSSAMERAVELLPELVDKVSALIKEHKGEKPDAEEVD
jgi:sporulation protein YtfJ